jgi:hypothetical protein
MAIVYLDVDDEITSAAARIRTAEEVEIAIVLPAGSRIATSRINFRLLAHEAQVRSRRLSIVAPEASTRALAASAGLPAFATVVEYEDAHVEGSGGGAPVTESAPPPGDADAMRTVAGAAAAAGVVAAAGAAGAARAGRHARPVEPPAAAPVTARPGAPTPVVVRPAYVDPGRPRGGVGPSTGLGAGPTPATGRSRRWPLVLAALLVVALVGGAAAVVGYVVLPTATVTLKLAAVPVGPVEFTGTADPDAVAVDPATATIPADRVEIPLSATGTFKATGKRVESSPATGTVRWTNCDPTRAYTIPKGTIARTPAGVAFATRESVFLPVAILRPPRITCQNRNVEVQASRDGRAGNVPAGSITVVPGGLNSVVIRVNNPAATSGGTREEFPQVTQKDVAGAVATLTKQLDAQLAEVAADPPGVPAGSTPYPETARRGEPVPSEQAADLVDREVATFELTLTADGTVVAADPAPLEEIGVERVTAEVPAGMELREGSVRVDVGDGVVEGETIRYPVVAEAEAVRSLTVDEARALVAGMTATKAKAALAEYGTAEVVLWPDWATTVTTLGPRLTITVVGVPPVESSPRVTPSPAVTPAPSATAAP